MLNLREADLKGKRVLYRADYNVPLKNGVIQDDFRIVATYPTLDFLIEKGAKIILVSHVGRPDGHVIEELSLRPMAEKLAEHYKKHTVRLANQLFAPEVEESIAEMDEGDIILLPNIRFFADEETNSEAFGRQLANLADIYVDDAFAVIHRPHASIVAPPLYLPSYPGFLVEAELNHLGGILKDPAHPFVVIMGGAKVSDKIEVIRALGKVADTLLIGGAMANTFLLAQGENIGASKAEPEKRHLAEELMKELGEKIFLAPDYVKEEENGEFRYLDIGEKSIQMFEDRLKDAKTVFWNGSLGYTEQAPYDKATRAIAEYVGNLKDAHTIVAGGDTVEMLTEMKLHDKFTFVSTGGGAALDFLAGVELPGVTALENAKC